MLVEGSRTGAAGRRYVVATDRVSGDRGGNRCFYVLQGHAVAILLDDTLAGVEREQVRVVGQPLGEIHDLFDCIGLGVHLAGVEPRCDDFRQLGFGHPGHFDLLEVANN